MPTQKATSQPVRKLERTKEQRECAGEAMRHKPARQEPQSLPRGLLGMEQKPGSVKHDEHHQRDESKQEILRPVNPRPRVGFQPGHQAPSTRGAIGTGLAMTML